MICILYLFGFLSHSLAQLQPHQDTAFVYSILQDQISVLQNSITNLEKKHELQLQELKAEINKQQEQKERQEQHVQNKIKDYDERLLMLETSVHSLEKSIGVIQTNLFHQNNITLARLDNLEEQFSNLSQGQ